MESTGISLPEAYNTSLLYLYDYGNLIYCQDYKQQMIEMPMTIVVKNPLCEPMISKIFPGGHRELQQYVMEICDGILDFMVGVSDKSWEYTYHNRIIKDNQINFIINELKRNPYSRRAVIDIRDNKIDQNNEHPACLQHIQFMIRHDKLDMYVTMRSNDAYRATFMNAFAFIMFQKKIADILNIKIGKYEHRANSFHVYEKNFNQFFETVKKIKKYGINSEELTYYYNDFYKDLMEEEIPNIMKMINEQKRKYGVK